MQLSSKVHPESCSIPLFLVPSNKTSPKEVSSQKNSPVFLNLSESNLCSLPHPQSADNKLSLNKLMLKDLPAISTFDCSDLIQDSFQIDEKKFKLNKNLINQVKNIKNKRNSENLLKTCRICLDSDLNDEFISPCACRGHQRWVHQKCLQIWLVKSERLGACAVGCEVCKEEFAMEFEYRKSCAPCSEQSCRTWLPIVIALILFSFIGCFVVQGYIDGSVRGLIVFAVSVIFGIIGMVSFGIGVANAKGVCVESRVYAWKVLNRG